MEKSSFANAQKFVQCTIDSVDFVISKENDLDKFANKIITEIESYDYYFLISISSQPPPANSSDSKAALIFISSEISFLNFFLFDVSLYCLKKSSNNITENNAITPIIISSN